MTEVQFAVLVDMIMAINTETLERAWFSRPGVFHRLQQAEQRAEDAISRARLILVPGAQQDEI